MGEIEEFKESIILPPLKEFEIGIYLNDFHLITVFSTLQLFEVRCMLKENPKITNGKKITFKFKGNDNFVGEFDKYGRMNRESKKDKRLCIYEKYLNRLMS